MALYSPKNCFKHSRKIKTVKDAITLPSKTLGQLKALYGRDWILAYIEMWLIDLNDEANVKNPMSSTQIMSTAERIYDGYSLKITDITLFFRNIKDGVYGAFYESLSREKIMEWLGRYYDERCEYASFMAGSSHEKFVMTKDKAHPKVVEKMFEGVGEEKVIHQHEKRGLGKQVFIDLLKKIGSSTTQELRDYLVNHDCTKISYDESIYRQVENELDRRNSKKTKQ